MAVENDMLLDVRSLRTTFLTPRGPLVAVDDVSFSLRRAETVGVVGESGSGKSVLVRSLMDLLPSTAVTGVEQQIVFDGVDLSAMPAAERRQFWGDRISMVFQDPMTSLNPVRRIGRVLVENIQRHLGGSRADATARAVELLGQVGIPEPVKRLRQYPHELSGGMRQRVMIAIALSCDPALLIADEPTTALDVTVQKQILDLLESLQQSHHMSVILITHDLGVVAGRTDRILVMYAGRVVESAPTGALFAETRHPYTVDLMRSIPRIEDPPGKRLQAIGGRPPDLAAPPPGCRYAPRCRLAQPECLESEPAPVAVDGDHWHRCHFPVGTEAGEAALEINRRAGVTAAGLRVDEEVPA
jgi:peptide/nickel transport system ATP-binding protein